jgi:hypothetical protein
MKIDVVTYLQINQTKWDDCIAQRKEGYVYFSYAYLCALANDWLGLIADDYSYVMPIVFRKKYGISYLYQPPFLPYIAVLGTNVTSSIEQAFLAAIPKNIKYWNFTAPFTTQLPFVHTKLAINYVLELNNHEVITKSYKENLKRNLKKCTQLGVALKINIPLKDVIALSKEQLLGNDNIQAADFEKFGNAFVALQSNAKTYGVYLNEQLLASAAVIYDKYRLYYILVGNHPNGKTVGASHFLVDAIIKDNCGKNLIFDFEGSDIASLGHFYSSFGATQENYYRYHYNKLPLFVRWFKK